MAVVRGLFGATVIGGLLWAAPALAQTGTVNGRVVDSTTQQPLPGATIRLDGTQRGAQTRDDGTFTLTAVPTGRQQLRVSRIGYAAQLSPITVNEGANTIPPVRLRQLATTLAPVVAVGYGTINRNAVTTAVSTINTSEARVGVQTNVNQLIQGRAPGVQVTQNSGDPGSGAQIRVRGSVSLNGNDEPLYVIDNVPIFNSPTVGAGVGAGGDATNAQQSTLSRSPLAQLNPEDIADITILKDAAATAIYGSRAANGVVLITTKRGVAGTTSIDYDGYYAAGKQARSYDLLSGDQYRSFVASANQVYRQYIAKGDTTRATLYGLPNTAVAALGGANTDWQSAVARTANIQNHNLAFSGGSQSTQYRASLNYFDNPGVIDNTFLTRVQGRLNGTSRLLGDKLQLNLNLTGTQENDRYAFAENIGGFAGGLFINAVTFNPTYPVYAPSSTTTGSATPYFEIGQGAQNIRNPVGIANQIQDRSNTQRILGNFDANYAFLTGLTGTVRVGVDRSTGLRQSYLPLNSPVGAQYNGLAQQSNLNITNPTFQSTLTYDGSFDKGPLGQQSLNLLGGYEYTKQTISQFLAAVNNFTTDQFTFNNFGGAGSVFNTVPTSNLTNRVTVSYFGRVNYGIQDKYFLTASLRDDGASVFGSNNKYALFPSGAFSWRIAQEPWFKNNGLFSDLKLRFSAGASGFQAIDPYQTLPLIIASPTASYPFGGSLSTGVLPFQNANPNLKWQTTISQDVGIDFGLLNNRVTGTIDYYNKITKDLLYAVPVPQPAVVTTQLQNIGRVRNAGVELGLNGTVYNAPGKNLNVGVNLSFDRNRVVSLGGAVQQIFTGSASGRGQSGTLTEVIKPGLPLFTFQGPVFAGVDSTGNELFNHYDASGKVVGKVNLNGLGQYDQRILGNPNPKFTFGLPLAGQYNRFNFQLLVRGQTGFQLFNNTALVYASKSNATQNQNFFTSALNDGLALQASNTYSSRFIEQGDFIRLQNVTIGYDLNLRNITRRVSSARVYVSGDNLLLGTKYSGLDPEVFTNAGTTQTINGVTTQTASSRGVDYLNYPRARVFTLGTRLGF